MSLPAAIRAALTLALVAAYSPAGVAQPDPTTTDEIRVLEQQIHGLRELLRLGVTAEQRLKLSKVVSAYQRDRAALSAPVDAEALAQALAVVRDALLAGEEPTDEMWQAVQAARGEGEGRDQALQTLRQQALSDLAQVLTDEQRLGLALPPIGEMATNILRAFHQTRQLPADQRATMRGQIIGQVSAQMGQLAGAANVEAIRTTLQNWAGRVDGLQPGPGDDQGAQLVAEFVTELTPLLTPDPERLQERINGRLSQMLEEPAAAQLLEDSARAMGVQP
ncbi:MAG: hypothetical protein FJX74_16215 [Armatimonadetes bacterium]|nr:hypothetical protein [Armatimonadota bacterium]